MNAITKRCFHSTRNNSVLKWTTMGSHGLFVLTIFSCFSRNLILAILEDFALCHQDITLKPTDGILKIHSFKWLGFVQYIHTTTGLPHHSKAPRVVLVQREFVLGTATDMLHLPKNYKLGNVIFGDYEQEETDCDLSKLQIKSGMRCQRAYMEMPYSIILPHPEFSRFGVGNSLALVKLLRPLKSNYMTPICLPSLVERERKKKSKVVFMVDYLSPVPRDFDSERMAKKSLRLYTHKECQKHRMKSKLGSEGVTHVLCTSGCGVRPGAPVLSHCMDGTFELIGVAAGGGACSRRTMRRRLIKEPPLFIDVYPYVSWIINVVTAHELPKPYPHNFKLASTGTGMSVKKGHYLRKRRKQRTGWSSREFLTGNVCFKSVKKQRRYVMFYVEKFQVNADPPGKMHVNLDLSAGIYCTIMCARLLLPNRFYTPKIDGVGGYNISIYFETDWFPYTFYFALGLTGRNSTARDLYDWIDEQRPGYYGLK
ncbi:uncharacterized protein LOC128677794 [Plodia interpunctella]|uniref:uncharacterized protein LOC128677794 n=1 Tax=Plodia interpunctella TaxID=58824 RepID=UPI0023674D4D|nr:uncharacterized protein LOC128677794 [Plodia interpunctella]